jgi:hypothetical protein
VRWPDMRVQSGGVSKRRSIIARLVYLLVIAAGMIVLYLLIPEEVWQTIRETYFARNLEAKP